MRYEYRYVPDYPNFIDAVVEYYTDNLLNQNEFGEKNITISNS